MKRLNGECYERLTENALFYVDSFHDSILLRAVSVTHHEKSALITG